MSPITFGHQTGLPQNPTGINGSKAQRSIPGTFATGKGTTAQIKEFLSARRGQHFSAKDIGTALNKPARQLSKRLREMEERKTVSIMFTEGKVLHYFVPA